ncbi:hypothetical protein B4110_1845 [Parageobacillus toebii]|uniref:Uncharacterized protein n=1 Tax=Parageobacillus toebii TaxID=153151 RepID=A0A150N8U5_9BACL|nr:hypothetical protein B4110_1845 [Parageobacillus toebii]
MQPDQRQRHPPENGDRTGAENDGSLFASYCVSRLTSYQIFVVDSRKLELKNMSKKVEI